MDELLKRLGPENVKKMRIGVSLTSMGSQWMVQFADEIKEAGNKYGFGVVVLSASDDIQKHADDLKSLQSQQVDGIIVYAGNAQALAQTMTEVNSAGIPVVSCIGVDPGAKISAFVNASENQKGALIADGIAQEANGAVRNILVSCASIDFPVLNNRLRGFETRVKEKYPNLKIVERRLASQGETEFLDVIKEGLLANEDVDTTFGSFAWPIMGAYNAAKQLNRIIRVYGVDADEALVQLLAAGDLVTGLQVNWAAPNAYLTLFTLFRILAGEKVPYENPEPEAYAYFCATQKDAPLVLKILYGK